MALAMFIIGIVLVVMLAILITAFILDYNTRFNVEPIGVPLALASCVLALVLGFLVIINYFLTLAS